MATYIKVVDKKANKTHWVNLTQVQTVTERESEVGGKWLAFGFQNGHSLNVNPENVLITSVKDVELVENLLFKATSPKVKK
jgi:hypothetical protein